MTCATVRRATRPFVNRSSSRRGVYRPLLPAVARCRFPTARSRPSAYEEAA
ncbi:hypothetical protein ACFPM0_33060 [Pseudonocardia sulfidoxydans]|uniref:hypothetical protein n=1 Tax=Pseudonocardia sulfidoxydans TaxID=54011 RepID=UPI003611AB76